MQTDSTSGTQKAIPASSTAVVEPIRKSLLLRAPVEVAFRVFAEEMTSWWDLAVHHIGAVAADSVVVEGKVGGRWYERGVDGSECNWGRVLTWEPPHRLVLAWQVNAEWKFDETLHTEVEIVFRAEGNNSTRLSFEHRNLENYGPAAEMMRAMMGEGWPKILEQFSAAAERV